MVGVRPFKVIIFDVDNTLVYRLPRPVKTLLNFATEKGLPTYPNALQLGERCNYAYYACGQADEERVLFGPILFRRNYVAALLQAMCRIDDVTPWVDNAVEHLNRTPQRERCPAKSRQFLCSLHRAGYRLAAVSNRDGSLRPLLNAHGLHRYFMFSLSGGRAGVYKPDPEIFRIVLRTLGVAPEATLAIGDSYDADIVGAEKAGITGVLLDPLGVFPGVSCHTVKCLEELVPWLVEPHLERV